MAESRPTCLPELWFCSVRQCVCEQGALLGYSITLATRSHTLFDKPTASVSTSKKAQLAVNPQYRKLYEQFTDKKNQEQQSRQKVSFLPRHLSPLGTPQLGPGAAKMGQKVGSRNGMGEYRPRTTGWTVYCAMDCRPI